MGALVATLVLTRAESGAPHDACSPRAVGLSGWRSGPGQSLSPAPGTAGRARLSRVPPGRGRPIGARRSAALPPPQPTLAAQVLATLAQCCQEGTLRVNQFPGQVFVQEDATLVVVPAALDAVRQRLAPTGVRLPGNPLLFNDLAAAGYLLGAAGETWSKRSFRAPARPLDARGAAPAARAAVGCRPPPPYSGAILLDLPAEVEPTPAPATMAAP